MKLQTEINLNPEGDQIDYTSKILLLGSCFSENMGEKLDYFKFQNLQNPFGVIFNPVSIGNLIGRAIEMVPFSEDDIFLHNGIWKCLETHSELNSLSKSQCLDNLNSALVFLREAVISSTHIILTFGTSWVYRNRDDGKIVANCQKLPQKNFQKELLSIGAISKSIENIFNRLSEINPNAIIINTLSPVRHIKDGFAENSLSKAHLLSAIHHSLNGEISKKYFYFPSFEIMMDELRDYRFYAEDMIHPNKTAVEIIWKKFSNVWISSETIAVQKQIASIQTDLRHKPFNPQSTENIQFLAKLQQKIKSVTAQFPHIHF